MEPSFRLAGAEPLDQKNKDHAATQRLTRLIQGKTFRFVLSEGQDRIYAGGMIFEVFLMAGDTSVNQIMVEEGLLKKTGPLLPEKTPPPLEASRVPSRPAEPVATAPPGKTASPSAVMNTKPSVGAGQPEEKPGPAAQVEKKETKWWVAVLVYLFYILLGFTGATSLGMVMNKRWGGFIGLILIGGFAIYSLVGSIREGGGWMPPALTLAIILLFAGAGKRANRHAIKKYNLPR